MAFCAYENKVIVTKGGLNLINEQSVPDANTWKAADATPADYRPVVERQLLDLAIAHELGHAVQLETTGTVKQDDLQTELQADCYAGQAHRNNDLDVSPQEVAALYELINPTPSPTHGTATERSASFEKGIDGGACT